MQGEFSEKSGFESVVGRPAPVTVVNRDSPIIFSGPHNGIAVLDDPANPLGMPREWFEKAHEASDLHMQALFDAMIPRFSNASFISGNYSRLVADLNRMPACAIACESSEWDDLLIPGNTPEKLTDQEVGRRMSTVYWPYHEALTNLVNEKRNKFGGVVLVDLHSFSPSWQGLPREVDVGLLTLDQSHPLASMSAEYVRERSGYRYKPGEPYFLPARVDITAAPLIKERTRTDYLGFEIRNDLLATDKGREQFCEFFERYLNFLEAHPHYCVLFSNLDSAAQIEEPALQK